jgi:competence protein ComEA
MKRLVLLLATLLFSAFALAAVNINTATKEELDALPGIGPVKAQAIIDYRTKNGPFKTPEDIMKVRGIKEGEFGKLKGQISVSGASTPAAAPAMKAAPATKDTKAAPTLAPDAVVPPGPAPAKAQEAKTAAPAMAPAPEPKAAAKKDEKAMKADEAAAKKKAKEDEAAAKKKAKEDEAAAKKKAKADKAAADKAAKEQPKK